MIILDFEGVTRRHRTVFEKAIGFYSSLLIDPAKVGFEPTVAITLAGLRNLIEHTGDKAQIFCNTGPYDDDDEISFTINYDVSLNLLNRLRIIAHEMVHVKQFVYGELLHLSGYRSLWLGDEVKPDTMSYWDLPWEIEAHGREEGLCLRFLESLDNREKEAFGLS